ncbi:fatty acid binding protein 7, brain, b [Silurus meridionalis]|uniref:fatty acid binding protein 7, brain, b n=1 Tax=Silurus meridionalis TaxID=175797 RepID=UPI001EEBC50E|nr:fatty acid binding protein 7, brain, b [Silurus meridionalis]
MDAFNGSWKLVKSDHFTEYLSALGVSEEEISVAQSLKPTLTFHQDGESIVIKSVNIIFTSEVWFKLGEEFSEETRDHRKCKNVITLDEGKLVQVQTWDGKQTTIVREIMDDNMFMTLTFGDIASTSPIRRYK